MLDECTALMSPQYFKHSAKARWNDGCDANLNNALCY